MEQGIAEVLTFAGELKAWLTTHNDAVMAVLFLVFGVKLITEAIPPLVG